MGVALGDLNRDGVPELLLATGPDLPVLARRRAAPFNWIDVRARLTLDQETTTTGLFLVPWSPGALGHGPRRRSPTSGSPRATTRASR
jgi:hypothetical protein